MKLDKKAIYRLALPAILYNITEPLIGLADQAIIGQIPDDTVQIQGGIGLAVGIISTLVWGLAQMRTAVSSLVSQYLGKGRLDEIKSLVPQSLYLSLLLGAVFALITGYYFEDLTSWLYADTAELPKHYAKEYYHIRIIGLPFALFLAGMFGVFRGYQNTSYAMITSLIGGGLNIVLDLLFVHGVRGVVEPLGAEGVALASVISQFVMCVICVVFLYRKTPFNMSLRFKVNHEFRNMLLITWNMFLRTLALNVAFLLAIKQAGALSEETLTAYTIGINIWLFCSFFIDGFSNAGNAIAGKLLGAKDYGMLRRLGWGLMRINVTIAIGLGVALTLLYPFIAPFFNDDQVVQDIFNSFFWIVIICQPVNAIAYSFDGIFKGLGEAKFLRNMLMIGTLGLFIPSLVGLSYLNIGVFAIWIAFVIWMMFRAGSLVWKFNTMTSESTQS